MTYKEGQAVTYKPIGILGYIRRVNNRPQVNEGQQNYLVEVNGYLVTVYADQEDEYLAPAPPKQRPPLQEVINTTGQWQRCPICNGEGIVPAHGFTTTAVSRRCGVCQGKMIISRTNGRPPMWWFDTQTTDF